MWLRLEGKGSFLNSPDLKAFASAQAARGVNRFVVDLQRCSGMDSTFMGTLSCVACRLEDAEGWLRVVNAAGRNGELLRGLGLDELFVVEDGTEGMRRLNAGMLAGAESVELAAVPKLGCTKDERTGVCLEAHEKLAELDEANAVKFQDVIELMRETLHTAVPA